MSTLREIKLRVKSIKSTQKITKAMEMVAASKMRKAQVAAMKGRLYGNKLTEIISHLIHSSEPAVSHPLLQQRTPAKKTAYLLLTSNRGLCGAFNSNVQRLLLEKMLAHESKIVTVGRKGKLTMERLGKSFLADFSDTPGNPSLADTLGISGILMEEFLSGRVDEVYVVYNHFYSMLLQKPVAKKLLPIEPQSEFQQTGLKTDYIFESDEGGKEALLDRLLRRYVGVTVYQLLLESFASEQSARMMAMRKASDSAKEIVGNLSLEYNKGRQAKITTQILEIVAGSQ